MTTQELVASWTENNMIISGIEGLGLDSTKMWKAAKLDSRRLIAFAHGAESNPATALGFARCSADMLYDMIIGMNHRRWTGMIFVDSGFGQKKLYFNSGEFVFASSDLMDDRLGEVIYRDSIISLDQLTSFAVQVDRKTKFGQVLLRSGTFSNTDLWNSLKAQAREILRSIFLVDGFYIEVQSGAPPIEVTFEDGTEALLDAAYSFGAQFRSFCARITPNVRVFPVESPMGQPTQPGTFVGDILELCKDSPYIKAVLDRSKLADINTLVAIHKLVAAGRLRIDGLSEPNMTKTDGTFGNLKSRIDAYQVLHGLVVTAFHAASAPLPLGELAQFAHSLNHDDGGSIYLDVNGALPAESVSNMLQQCAINTHRIPYFQIRIESLMRYLLQMAGDLLPFEIAKKLKQDFKEII